MKRSLTRVERRYFDILQATPDAVPTSKLLRVHANRHSGANLVAQHIVNLRKKLAGEYVIEAVHGFGYQLFAVTKQA